MAATTHATETRSPQRRTGVRCATTAAATAHRLTSEASTTSAPWMVCAAAMAMPAPTSARATPVTTRTSEDGRTDALTTLTTVPGVGGSAMGFVSVSTVAAP